MLMLEHQEGSYNPTHSRVSRFAAADAHPNSAFGVTSRMFMNSTTQSVLSGYSSSSAQYTLPLTAQSSPQHRLAPQSSVQQADSQSSRQNNWQVTDQGQQSQVQSVSGSARSYAVHEEAPTRSQSTAQASQMMPSAQPHSQTRLSSSAQWLPSDGKFPQSPAASCLGMMHQLHRCSTIRSWVLTDGLGMMR